MKGRGAMRGNTYYIERLSIAIARARPQNGFITSGFIRHGWTGQPDYSHKR
jgi:hypothetical protein